MRLVSLNVWGLPSPISRDLGPRIDAIGARLRELAPDLVALQEVWTDGARRGLLAAGRRAGLAHAWHNPAALGGSGLLVLAREGFESARFEAFLLRGFPHRIWRGDFHGGKGFCALRFAGSGGAFTLINTHLHAQYTDDAHDDEHPHRVGQLVQLSAAIAQLADPVLAAGDFNMREGRPEYRVFTGLTGMRDAAAALDQREATSLSANPYRARRTRRLDERIDYVFKRDGEGRRLRVRSLERIFDEPLAIAGRDAAYSDHAGLLADVELEADPQSRAPRPDPAAAALAADVLAVGRSAAQSRRGEQRLAGGAALAAAVLAGVGARRPLLSRRRVLRAGLGAGALLALPVGLSNAALAEIAVPDEERAFDAVDMRLAALRALEAPRPS